MLLADFMKALSSRKGFNHQSVEIELSPQDTTASIKALGSQIKQSRDWIHSFDFNAANLCSVTSEIRTELFKALIQNCKSPPSFEFIIDTNTTSDEDLRLLFSDLGQLELPLPRLRFGKNKLQLFSASRIDAIFSPLVQSPAFTELDLSGLKGGNGFHYTDLSQMSEQALSTLFNLLGQSKLKGLNFTGTNVLALGETKRNLVFTPLSQSKDLESIDFFGSRDKYIVEETPLIERVIRLLRSFAKAFSDAKSPIKKIGLEELGLFRADTEDLDFIFHNIGRLLSLEEIKIGGNQWGRADVEKLEVVFTPLKRHPVLEVVNFNGQISNFFTLPTVTKEHINAIFAPVINEKSKTLEGPNWRKVILNYYDLHSTRGAKVTLQNTKAMFEGIALYPKLTTLIMNQNIVTEQQRGVIVKFLELSATLVKVTQFENDNHAASKSGARLVALLERNSKTSYHDRHRTHIEVNTLRRQRLPSAPPLPFPTLLAISGGYIVNQYRFFAARLSFSN